MPPERLHTDRAGIDRAAELLLRGELVAFPTETVYGLGADATNGRAVAALFAAKGRPRFNPLIAHVPDADAARALTVWSATAEHLASRFWPGPLTLVLPIRAEAGISGLVTAGLPSLAVRVPSNASARALLRATGRPVAAPSANPSGRISPTHADHVTAGLGSTIAAILDDGPCDVGVESTIVGLIDEPRLLRSGGLPVEAIEDALGQTLADPLGPISAPGQMASHYAPRASVRLNARTHAPGEILIGFGAVRGQMSLSERGDLTEAAANLFACLHDADATGLPIAVAPVPDTGLGRAINDRLRRAAAPR